jgi:hypothetical protein
VLAAYMRPQPVAAAPRLPSFAIGNQTLHDLMIGTIFVALPRVPLTLGNAVIAITEETGLPPLPDGKVR